MKICKKCHQEKSLSEFHRLTRSLDGHQPVCKVCAIAFMAEYQRENREKVNAKNLNWKKENPERASKSRKEYKRRWRARVPADIRNAQYRKWRLKRAFRITPEQYQSMLDVQGGVCAICKCGPGKLRLSIDHCHKTNKNRGLLCGKCNTSLERIEFNPHWGEWALIYLEQWG